TEADYLHRWNELFGWGTSPAEPATAKGGLAQQLQVEMARKKISCRTLAAAVDADHSFLAKVLKGSKGMPGPLREKAEAWLAAQAEPPAQAAVEVAMSYLARGWSVIPQVPGLKQPPIKWKAYQDRLPTEKEVASWYKLWPN